jgi:hypothetical protein
VIQRRIVSPFALEAQFKRRSIRSPCRLIVAAVRMP